MGVFNPNERRVGPTLGRHPDHPVPAQKPTGVFAQPLGSPTRNLTRPAPVQRAERRLPPAPMPSYPVLRHYTPAQQRTVVQGTQRAGTRVHDRGAIAPRSLAPLAAVRRQQEGAANRRYARGFGVTPQQAAALRAASNAHPPLPASAGVSAKQLLGIGPPAGDFLHRLAHALLTGDTGQGVRLGDGTPFDPTRPALQPLTGLIRAGLQPAPTGFNPVPKPVPYSGLAGMGTLEGSLGQQSAANTVGMQRTGDLLQQYLHRQANAERSSRGGGVINEAAVLPVGNLLDLAAGIAPTASRLTAGAAGDIGQYVLGAVPATVDIGGQALHNPGAALHTLLSSTEDILKHPQDHPLFALQLLHGGVHAVSRAAGAVGRSGALGGAVREGLNTRRAPLQIGGPANTRLLEYRHYSKDPLVMALQKSADRRLKPGAQVVDQHGRTVRAQLAPTAELGGGIRRSIAALHTSTLGQDTRGRLHGYGDFTADRANAVERHNRALMQRELVKMMPTRAHRGGRIGQGVGGYLDRVLHAQPHGVFALPRNLYRPERSVLGLVIRGRIRNAGTFRTDLVSELGRLKTRAAESFDHPAERELNLQNQQAIERVLADPRAMRAENVKRLVDAGRQIAVRGRELTRQAVRQGALSPEAAARAPLYDYAIAHMGARYVHPEQHRALEQQALVHERAAAQRVHDLQRSKPLVADHEVKAYTRRSVVKEPVYTLRSPETARTAQSMGLDPGRGRKGTYGSGTYGAIGRADRRYPGDAVQSYVDVRKPLVLHEGDPRWREYRQRAVDKVGGTHDLPAVSQEMTRLMRADGYDSVIIKGKGEHGEDWINVFDPHQVRVVAPKTTVRTGPLDTATVARIAKEEGVRVVSHESRDLGSVVQLQGARDHAHIAAARMAEETGTASRLVHEADGGAGAAYFAGGKLVAIEPHFSAETLSRLHAAHGSSLSVRRGDVADIHPGQLQRVRGASEAARRANPARSSADQPRNDGASHERLLAEARTAHAQARATRIAVSGRDPALVDRHEQAVARAASAKRDMKQAQAAHARAVQQHDRAVGAVPGFRDRRAIAHGERPTGRTITATDRQLLAGHDTAVKHALQQRRAAEAVHREARAAVPKRPDIVPALRTAEGRLLTNEDIHAHMRSAEGGIPFDRHGPLVAYVPDRADLSVRSNFHRAQALLKRDTVESGFHRTGAAQLKGITGQSFEHVADHMVRMGITTGAGAIGQFDKLAREVGMVDKDGRPFDSAGAADALSNLNAHPDQPRVVAVRMYPGRYSPGQRDLIERIQSAQPLDPSHYGNDLATYVEKSFADRVLGPDALSSGDRARNIALMPEELVKRYQQHLTALANRSPTGALLAKGFRTAVLPFSAKWLTGNVAEAVLRLAVIGANPFDYAAGRRVMRAAQGRPARTVMGRQVMREIIGLDVQHAGLSTEVGSSLLGGLLYGEPGLTIHRGASDYEHSNLRIPAQALGGAARTTMLGEIGHELMKIPRAIFHLNRVLEQQSQLVALGRYARRDIQEFTGSYVQTLRLQHTAIQEAARGLYNTAAQRDAAHFIDETLGKYSRFNPRLRALIQTATPFLPWYLNAARFVFWTMPMKHPTTTAVLVAAEHAFAKDLQDQHKDLPPGELKSAVKSGGGWLDLARFTPWGAFTGLFGGDPSTVAAPVLPQAQGIYHALEGQDPFGRPLQVPKTADNPKGKPTSADIWKTVADQGIGSFLPGYSPIERVAQHGETPYSGRNSLLFGIHTKPGSSHGSSGLERWLNPVRPVYLHPAAGAATGPPPGVSQREYQLMLREARSAAQAAPQPNSREQQLLLKEARQAAGR